MSDCGDVSAGARIQRRERVREREGWAIAEVYRWRRSYRDQAEPGQGEFCVTI